MYLIITPMVHYRLTFHRGVWGMVDPDDRFYRGGIIAPLMADTLHGITAHLWAYGVRDGKWDFIREEEDHQLVDLLPVPSQSCCFRTITGETGVYHPEEVYVDDVAPHHFEVSINGWPLDVVEILPDVPPRHYRVGDRSYYQDEQTMKEMRDVPTVS